MSTAAHAVGIRPEFIDQVRTKLRDQTVEHYINGQWTPGARGQTFETLDPSTNQVLSHACRGHAEDIDRAACAARSFSRNCSSASDKSSLRLLSSTVKWACR